MKVMRGEEEHEKSATAMRVEATFGLGKTPYRGDGILYLQTSNSRVGRVGELLLGQVIWSTLVTGGPVWQKTLVARAVGDGVGCGTGQAEQNCVIGQMDLSQTKSHPLPGEVPGSSFLTVV